MSRSLILLIITLSVICSCNNDSRDNSLSQSRIEKKYIVLDSLNNLFLDGNLNSSRIGMEQYVEEYPDADYGFGLLGSIYLQLNEDSLAKISIEKAISINPGNYGALTSYGIFLDKRKNYEAAEKFYKKAINIKPDFFQAYSNLMSNQINLGYYQQARIYGEKAVELGHKDTDKGLLCAIYHKLGVNDKRDSLYIDLKNRRYKNLNNLEEIIFDN